jgi:hypothetical protein
MSLTCSFASPSSDVTDETAGQSEMDVSEGRLAGFVHARVTGELDLRDER